MINLNDDIYDAIMHKKYGAQLKNLRDSLHDAPSSITQNIGTVYYTDICGKYTTKYKNVIDHCEDLT